MKLYTHNGLYSSVGNGDLALAKWVSVLEHVQNCHHFDDPLFPTCAHGANIQDRPWIETGKYKCGLIVTR
jgi:hypothetical protein